MYLDEEKGAVEEKMRNDWDFERFGEDIKRTVQGAVDSGDFRRLNQTIQDTIGRAVNSFGDAYRQTRENKKRTEYYYGQQEQKTYDWQKVDLEQLKQPKLYAKTTATKVLGTILAGIGYSAGGALLLGFLVTGITTLVMGGDAGMKLALAILLVLVLGCSVMAGIGTSMLGRVKRFQNYVRWLDNKTCCNISELSERYGKKKKYIVKDLEWMIARGWFLQGHLDEERTCLITTNAAYDDYKRLMVRMREEKLRSESEAYRQKQKEEKEQKRKEAVDPKIQEIVEAGNRYIEKLRECNDAIPGEIVSEKISRMELLTKRIFERVEQEPDTVSDIRRLMEYYLPTAVKLLEAYEELDGQPVQGENILSSKKEIEDTLDTLNSAFEKLLDSLFQDTAWDVSSDISVLKTMLAQEGLTGHDFQTGGKR